MKKYIFPLFILIIFLGTPVSCKAYSGIVSASAQLQTTTIMPKDDFRVKRLNEFFEEKDSPLAEYSYVFVSEADKYNLDWRLVPAITGVESSFGKRIPLGSYNAYGWANGNYSFLSWDDSIEVVSKTLRTKYLDRGATTVDEISAIYAPPSTTWAWKVKYFMDKIEPLPLTFTL